MQRSIDPSAPVNSPTVGESRFFFLLLLHLSMKQSHCDKAKMGKSVLCRGCIGSEDAWGTFTLLTVPTRCVFDGLIAEKQLDDGGADARRCRAPRCSMQHSRAMRPFSESAEVVDACSGPYSASPRAKCLHAQWSRWRKSSEPICVAVWRKSQLVVDYLRLTRLSSIHGFARKKRKVARRVLGFGTSINCPGSWVLGPGEEEEKA